MRKRYVPLFEIPVLAAIFAALTLGVIAGMFLYSDTPAQPYQSDAVTMISKGHPNDSQPTISTVEFDGHLYIVASSQKGGLYMVHHYGCCFRH